MTRKRHVEPPASPEAPSYKLSELAARWRVSRHTIVDAIRKGKLRAFKVGELQYRVSAEEVARYEQQGLAVAS